MTSTRSIMSAIVGGSCAAAFAVVACSSDKAATKKEEAPKSAQVVDAGAPPPPPPSYDRLSRAEFNRIAVELNQPLFWTADANTNNTVEPAELGVLWHPSHKTRGDFVDANGFTPAFTAAYESMVKIKSAGHPANADAAQQARITSVLKELEQGRATIVASDFAAAPEEDKAIVKHILAAADVIERLHARQLGTLDMPKLIPADDTASLALFFRNQGPWCAAPATEKDEACTATKDKQPRISGLYPADLQQDKAFCEVLNKHKDQKALMDPFVVVGKDASGNLVPVPYNVAYKDDMLEVSNHLKAAADAIKAPEEAAFKTYLAAAAQAFVDNNWQPADEAWAKMNVTNSKWYLRIGPDEVYYEPCNSKGGFHVSFARINQDSLTWQKKLDPVKGEMEKALATLAGKPYKARAVTFHLPDFIDVVLNAGDARPPHGATIGQSLPNWGPVANEGRGRTVAMTNFYTDDDSKKTLKEQVESLLCAASMKTFVSNPEPQIMSTVLHEAAHNLGPSHEYKVKGKTAREIFEGPLASTLEELKAQTSALYFTDWLVEKKIITLEEAQQAHTRDVAWAFGHISRGMYEADNKPKSYSQLAAIEMGYLLKSGAIEWKAEEMAANGKDKGCFELKLDKWPADVKKLETQVLAIKAKGDKKAAEALKKEFVDDDGQWKTLRETIKERWLRSPKATFVYSINL